LYSGRSRCARFVTGTIVTCSRSQATVNSHEYQQLSSVIHCSEHPNLDSRRQKLLSNGLIPKQGLPEILPNLRNRKQRPILCELNPSAKRPQHAFASDSLESRYVKSNKIIVCCLICSLGIGKDLADSVRGAGCDAYLGFLEMFNLFGDFKVFCEELVGSKIRLDT
jgi:hypothetical protein